METGYHFNARETATLLHALRQFQRQLDDEDGSYRDAIDGTGHFEQVPPLTADEIDALCERLNLREDDAQPAAEPAPTCKHCADEIEDDSAGDWIHKTGFYGCVSNDPDNCGAWTCAEPADSAA